jgi:hypothetical protein
MVLRRIFEPKRDEITVGCRELHNEELHNMNSPPNFIGIIKSRRMRIARYVTCMREEGSVYKILVGKPKATRKADQDVDGDNIKWISEN